MRFLDEDVLLVKIYDILYRLGVTANYTGFFYTAHAVWLCVHQPERLMLVTKWLYPDVAAHYGTNWKAVERDIRTVVAVAWRTDPQFLSALAGSCLSDKPRTAQFLSILANGVRPKFAA